MGVKSGLAAIAGAALAAVAGTMLGGAMRPQLVFDGRPLGPQIFAPGGGNRATPSFEPGASYASYGDDVPSYVIGTDNIETAEDEAPLVDDWALATAESETSPSPVPAFAHATYDDPPLPEVVYPSQAGGARYDRRHDKGYSDPYAPPPPAPPRYDPSPVTG
jgi:hypothetical protein